MPAPVTVTDEDIVMAGRTLAAEGRAVSGWSLRGVIGRGDPVRLDAVWQRMRDVRPAVDAAVPVSVALPPVVEACLVAAQEAVTERMAALAGDLWQAAERLAAERLHRDVDIARMEAADLRMHLNEAHAIVTAADDQVDAAEARAEAAEAAAEATRQDASTKVAAARDDLRLALEALGRVQGMAQPVPPAEGI